MPSDEESRIELLPMSQSELRSLLCAADVPRVWPNLGCAVFGHDFLNRSGDRGGEPSVTWVLFDTEGHFSHVFRGELTNIQIAPGIGQEVFLQDDPGELQAKLWLGRPPVGPFGEPPSLGSRQFPPITLGKTSAWLLPPEAQNIYFLLERPVGPGRGREWRSGTQQLFGPFTAKKLPTALVMD